MYKQKSCGSKGPILPLIFIICFSLIIFSIIDTAILHGFAGVWVYISVIFISVIFIYLFVRFSLVSFEYIFMGEEIIIRKVFRDKIVRLTIIDVNCILFFGSPHFRVGLSSKLQCNCCATIKGFIFNRHILIYRCISGKKKYIIFEPDNHMSKMITDSILRNESS